MSLEQKHQKKQHIEGVAMPDPLLYMNCLHQGFVCLFVASGCWLVSAPFLIKQSNYSCTVELPWTADDTHRYLAKFKKQNKNPEIIKRISDYDPF